MRNRERILRLLKEKVLLLDGAYGTEFIKMGLEDGKPSEALNIENPGIVYRLQRSYVKAGVDILLTNTFNAVPYKLEELGYGSKFEEIVRIAVKIAKKASNGRTFVFGDCGPTGVLPRPMGNGNFDFYYKNYERIIKIFLDEKVDGIIFETFPDILELKAAVMAVRDLSKDTFLIAHLTFDENGKTLSGTDPMNFALTFGKLDIDVLGMNCTLGPEEMLCVFQELSKYHDGFLSVEPNAGEPIIIDGKIVYTKTPEDFAIYVDTFWKYGANIIGGCCGSGPEHIKLMRKVLGHRSPIERRRKKIFAITSPSKVVKFDHFIVIGERINPAGRKKLWNSMLMKNFEYIRNEAVEQMINGADILDINFGVEQSVDWNFARDIVELIPYEVNIPLSLDIQETKLLEILLKVYPGNPIVNSSKVDEKEMRYKIKLIKKYGGILIVLAMEKDIPKDVKDRIDAIKKAIEIAYDNDIDPRERFIFDPVVTPLGVSRRSAVDVLKTIRWLSKNGYKSTLGLSNLSFGLPNRSYYHSSFLSLAIEKGLSSAIMNPLDKNLMENMKATLRILDKLDLPEGKKIKKKDESCDVLNLILLGKKRELLEFVKEMLKKHKPMDVVEEYLKPAMKKIGDMYDEQDIFLPQLILATQTVKSVFELIEKSMKKGKANLGKFLIATVKGDIHDIGKNIVAAFVRSSGFEVIDLGKDVSNEKIIDAVKREKPIALGLSAVMTTVLPRIKEIANLMEKEGIKIPIIVGGTAMDEKLIQELNTLYWAESASDVVKILKSIVNEKNS